MKAFEYKTIFLEGWNDDDIITLDDIGRDGWELINFIQPGRYHRHRIGTKSIMWIFKRQLD